MPHISVIVRGTENDHRFRSPELSKDEAEKQLAEIQLAAGSKKPTIPWLSVQAVNIIAAQLIDE